MIPSQTPQDLFDLLCAFPIDIFIWCSHVSGSIAKTVIAGDALYYTGSFMPTAWSLIYASASNWWCCYGRGSAWTRCLRREVRWSRICTFTHTVCGHIYTYLSQMAVCTLWLSQLFEWHFWQQNKTVHKAFQVSGKICHFQSLSIEVNRRKKTQITGKTSCYKITGWEKKQKRYRALCPLNRCFYESTPPALKHSSLLVDAVTSFLLLWEACKYSLLLYETVPVIIQVINVRHRWEYLPDATGNNMIQYKENIVIKEIWTWFHTREHIRLWDWLACVASTCCCRCDYWVTGRGCFSVRLSASFRASGVIV